MLDTLREARRTSTHNRVATHRDGSGYCALRTLAVCGHDVHTHSWKSGVGGLSGTKYKAS